MHSSCRFVTSINGYKSITRANRKTVTWSVISLQSVIFGNLRTLPKKQHESIGFPFVHNRLPTWYCSSRNGYSAILRKLNSCSSIGFYVRVSIFDGSDQHHKEQRSLGLPVVEILYFKVLS